MEHQFQVKLQVIQHQADYIITIGRDTLKRLQLNTSIIESTISWEGNTIAMPPCSYWTEAWIRQYVKQNKMQFKESFADSDGSSPDQVVSRGEFNRA